MSHVTTVDLEIRDLDCLAAAAKELGLELVRDAKNYKWYGEFVGDYNDPAIKELGITPENHGKCDHKLRVVGAGSDTYEIGLVKHGDSYRVLFDFWRGGYGLMQRISKAGERGQDCSKLKQAYALEVAKKELRRQGKRFREVRQDGKVKLVAAV